MTMKRKERDSKMKSILTFSKWTKINVQKWIVKNTLTHENNCLDKKYLS